MKSLNRGNAEFKMQKVVGDVVRKVEVMDDGVEEEGVELFVLLGTVREKGECICNFGEEDLLDVLKQ